jgi:hypothetical protein
MRLLLAIILIISFHAVAQAQTAGETVISGTIVKSHDRLPPYEVRDIVTEIHFKFVLSGENHVEEHWSHVALRNASNPNLNLRGPDSSGESTLGESGSNVSWHVQGTHSLQRIAAGNQFIVMMSIKIDDKKRCAIGVRYLLQKGKSYVIVRRDDNGEDARFTISRVISSSCSIE